MPDLVLAKYYDPKAERQRLLVHDYQQTQNLIAYNFPLNHANMPLLQSTNA